MEEELLKRKIEELIESNRFSWRKSAFYSDPEVAPIIERLYERWEASGRQGKPLDYADLDELRLLADKAERYAFMDDETARAITFGRMSGEERPGESSLAAFLRALLRGRRRR